MSGKDLSTWEWNDVKEWLTNNKMDKYISNFQKCQVNGYDLCYLANEDFNEMSISSFHDKNIILKSIRTLTLEQLKLKISYENKTINVQLDFDPSFTVDILSNELRELFHIQNKIYLTTGYDNEILMPNLKIVELILLNPTKYKQIKILNERDSGLFNSNVNDYSLQKTKQLYSTNYSLYEQQNKYPSTNNVSVNIPSILNVPKKDLEKDSFKYKDNIINNSVLNVGGQIPQNTENPLHQTPIAPYKSYKEYGIKDSLNQNSGREYQRSYTPNERERNPNANINDNNQSMKMTQNLYEQKSENSNYMFNNNGANDVYTSSVGLRNNTPNYRKEDYTKNDSSFYSRNNELPGTQNVSITNNFPPNNTNSYLPNYMQYNPTNQGNKTLQKDNKKYSSEKRMFRMGDNSDMNEIQMKPAVGPGVPQRDIQNIRMNNTGGIPEKFSSYGLGAGGNLNIDNQFDPTKNKHQKNNILLQRNYEFDMNILNQKNLQNPQNNLKDY